MKTYRCNIPDDKLNQYIYLSIYLPIFCKLLHHTSMYMALEMYILCRQINILTQDAYLKRMKMRMMAFIFLSRRRALCPRHMRCIIVTYTHEKEPHIHA